MAGIGRGCVAFGCLCACPDPTGSQIYFLMHWNTLCVGKWMLSFWKWCCPKKMSSHWLYGNTLWPQRNYTTHVLQIWNTYFPSSQRHSKGNALLTHIFMSDTLKQFLITPLLIARYIDDIFIIWTNSTDLLLTLLHRTQHFQPCHPLHIWTLTNQHHLFMPYMCTVGHIDHTHVFGLFSWNIWHVHFGLAIA